MDRRDSVTLLEEHALACAPELSPVRFGRMVVSNQAYLTGAGVVMAADLATTADSGLTVQLCGDANIDNFAWFLRPDGSLVFDLDHFDETRRGPWEWDLKRFATSLEVASRERGVGTRQRRRLVRAAIDAYCDAMRQFASRDYMAIACGGLDEWMSDRRPGDGKFRHSARLAPDGDRGFRFVSSPPAIERFADMIDQEDSMASATDLESDLVEYRETLDGDHRLIIDRFAFADAARKTADLWDTATRTVLLVFVSRDRGEPLVLEAKEVPAASTGVRARRTRMRSGGRRVVEGRRLIESAEDVLTGWFTGHGWYGVPHDYHVRQAWPKFIPTPRHIEVHEMLAKARTAARTIARAHARTGDRVAIANYMGRREVFPAAVSEFAIAYADQNEIDRDALVAAAARGRVVTRSA